MVLFDDIVEILKVVPALILLLVVPVLIGERSELSDREKETVLSMVDDFLQLVEVRLIVPGAVGVEDEAERKDEKTEKIVFTEDDERPLNRDDEAENVVLGEVSPEEDEVLLRRNDEVEEVASIEVVDVKFVSMNVVPIKVVLEEDEKLLGRDDKLKEITTEEDNE